jgi:hypothetical protein
MAAMAAPLESLARGEYRLAIAATDRLARTSATAETRFSIIATPTSLLAGAPVYSARVRRSRFMDADLLGAALDALAGPSPSAEIAPLIERARQQQFASLLPDTVIPASSRGAGLLVQAIARYGLGDTPGTVAAQIRRALEAGAPEGAAQYWMGACRAAEGRDEEAVAAWDSARAKGWPASLLATPTAEALVRLNRLADAGSHARQDLADGVRDPELTHIAASADIAAGRFEAADQLLTKQLLVTPDDGESQWLLVHALFASAIRREGPGASTEGRARLVQVINRYLEGGGRYSIVAQEWLTYLTSSSGAP